MSCQNCFTGCSEITSDRCVRYTGEDISSLGIVTGNSLSEIEKALTDYLLTVMDGTGIHPDIEADTICTLVRENLQECGTLTITDFINALIKTSCTLEEQLVDLTESIATIEADYTVDCLEGVIDSSGTHAILQAVIVKLCTMEDTLAALALNLSTNYSSNGAELDAYIANYIATHSGSTGLISAKMIPYVAYPYFNTDLSNFNANGEGIGDWVDVYLCNGYGGKTPDMRGRVPVAATSGPGPAMTDPAVIPGGFNYVWTVGGAVHGANSVTLTSTQVPNHTHTATSTATVPQHWHWIFNSNELDGSPPPVAGDNFAVYTYDDDGDWKYQIKGSATSPTLGRTDNSPITPITPEVIIAATSGGGNAHSNTQPGIACYYIMYVPV